MVAYLSKKTSRAALIASAALLMAACSNNPQPTSTPSAPVDSPLPYGTVIYFDGENEQSASFNCNEKIITGFLADGSIDDLCQGLEENKELFVPTEPDPTIACTDIYGGPQKLSFGISLDNQTYSKVFGRENGCNIAEFALAAEIIGLEIDDANVVVE